MAVARLVPGPDWHALRVGSAWVTFLGVAVLLASTAFTLWARVALGTMWSMDAAVKEGHKLQTNGPYGITRHPIYTGMLEAQSRVAAWHRPGRHTWTSRASRYALS